MKIETRTEIQEVPPNTARIWVVVTVDGEEHRYVLVSGPKDDVKAYYEGQITFPEIRRRWIMGRLDFSQAVQATLKMVRPLMGDVQDSIRQALVVRHVRVVLERSGTFHVDQSLVKEVAAEVEKALDKEASCH